MSDAATDRQIVPASSPSHDQPRYLEHQQIVIVLFGLMAGVLLAALDQSIVDAALPRIVSELGGLDKLAWVVTAYLLTATAATPLWGKISDLYGRRPIFQAAIMIFLVGSILCGLSQNLPQLIAFRALQGVGGGALMAIDFSIIGDIIPPRERGRYQGDLGAVFGVSSVAGPLLGGWFTEGPGWRWIDRRQRLRVAALPGLGRQRIWLVRAGAAGAAGDRHHHGRAVCPGRAAGQ